MPSTVEPVIHRTARKTQELICVDNTKFDDADTVRDVIDKMTHSIIDKHDQRAVVYHYSRMFRTVDRCYHVTYEHLHVFINIELTS